MLTATGLRKTYGSLVVLDDVSLTLDPGQIICLIGPNGAGKSTLLHVLLRLAEPSAGEIDLDGVPSTAPEYGRRLGFCPDDLPQPDLLTGREYLELVCGVRRMRRIPAGALRLVEGLRLDTALDRLVATYSHGMKRKLQLVAALVHAPDVLVLDEPFRGLDPETAALVTTFLRLYARGGRTVLVSTHDLLLTENLADAVLVLDRGRLRSLPDRGDATLTETFLEVTGLAETTARASELFFDGLDELSRATPR